MLQTLFLLGLLAATLRPCLATQCVGDSSVCHAYAAADVVFIGRVVDRNPDFDMWGRNLEKELESLFPGRKLEDLETDESAETTARLRQFYLSFVRGPARTKIAGARTGKQLRTVVEEILAGSQTVRFEVQHTYKGLAPGKKEVEIESEFSMGLPRFDAQEVYLVYAHRGKEQRLEVGNCSRSSKVTFAGADLGYLHHIEYGGTRSGRVYGFVTTDKKVKGWQVDRGEVADPVEDVMVALRAPGMVFFATTDPKGSFVFDGLEPGEYEATVYQYEDWYIVENGKLAGPQKVRVNQQGCERLLFQIEAPKKEK